MSLHALPPVYSPLSARAVAAGIQAALAGGSRARAAISVTLAAHYHPVALALTDSGTSALALACRLAVARRPGRPVLLPAWGCFDLATAALAADVHVLFYDVDPATLGPDWNSLEAAARLEPAAAVGVHFYGVPIDWARFESLLRPTGATLIEDAAQGAGAEIAGRSAGRLGDLSVLSFGRGKGTTGGRGGALLAHDPTFAAQVQGAVPSNPRGGLWEALALTAQWVLTRPSLFGLPAGLPWLGLGQTVFLPPHPLGGITGLAAGVLEVTLSLAEAETAARRENAARLKHELHQGRLELIEPVLGTHPGWLRMPARLRSGNVQALARDRVARLLGIYPSYPRLLGTLPGMAERVVGRNEGFSGAMTLIEQLLTLPTHSAVQAPDVRRLVAWSGGIA